MKPLTRRFAVVAPLALVVAFLIAPGTHAQQRGSLIHVQQLGRFKVGHARESLNRLREF